MEPPGIKGAPGTGGADVTGTSRATFNESEFPLTVPPGTDGPPGTGGADRIGAEETGAADVTGETGEESGTGGADVTGTSPIEDFD